MRPDFFSFAFWVSGFELKAALRARATSNSKPETKNPQLRTRIAAFVLATFFVLPAHAESIKVLVQSSPLAGFQHYAGRELWDDMKAGDALTLAREPDNPHDAGAVSVSWRGRKLGYLPRAENRAVAAEMDRGGRVEARIARLLKHRSPWQRVQIEVYVVL
jgi:hypothetical protein